MVHQIYNHNSRISHENLGLLKEVQVPKVAETRTHMSDWKKSTMLNKIQAGEWKRVRIVRLYDHFLFIKFEQVHKGVLVVNLHDSGYIANYI